MTENKTGVIVFAVTNSQRAENKTGVIVFAVTNSQRASSRFKVAANMHVYTCTFPRGPSPVEIRPAKDGHDSRHDNGADDEGVESHAHDEHEPILRAPGRASYSAIILAGLCI